MIRKVAMPVSGTQIEEKFESAATFKVYTVVKKLILNAKLIKLEHRDPGITAHILKENDVSEVLARKIEHSTIEIMNIMKINVFVGVEGGDADNLMMEHLQGRLVTNDQTGIE
jgi:predicted Fe-Mo cluster-binding NifX family protein